MLIFHFKLHSTESGWSKEQQNRKSPIFPLSITFYKLLVSLFILRFGLFEPCIKILALGLCCVVQVELRDIFMEFHAWSTKNIKKAPNTFTVFKNLAKIFIFCLYALAKKLYGCVPHIEMLKYCSLNCLVMVIQF